MAVAMDMADDFGIAAGLASQRPSLDPILTGYRLGGSPYWRPGFQQVRKGIVDQWEQLHNDESLKDVEILLNDDAIILADSLVLKVVSPEFRKLLNEQAEPPAPKEEEEVHETSLEIEGGSRIHVPQEEEEEQPALPPRSSPSASSSARQRVKVNSTEPEFRFFLRLLYTGRMDPAEWPAEEPCYEHEQLPMLPGSLVSQPPATTEPVLPLDGRHHLAGPLPGPSFAHVPEGGFPGHGSAKGKGRGSFRRAPSINLLLAAASLARTYKVDWLLHVLIEVMKERITEVSFDSILCGAVAYDITPLRLAALDFAWRSGEVWRRYSMGEYSPQVMYELSMNVWPAVAMSASNQSDIMAI